mmetsp:Transcript_24171/g.27594  ORF Transcript_24171/g.27594 Transcript_24171/m.27594 type:complete len:326 (-) Transcript_24171:142-1119(-)
MKTMFLFKRKANQGKKKLLKKNYQSQMSKGFQSNAENMEQSATESSFQRTVDDELYGQIIPEESPQFVESKLNELQIELDKIQNAEKADWTMAMANCPQLCDDKFKLMFLRCEGFNIDLAAKRIVKYWATRVKIFGESKAFLPLVLGEDGPFKDDNESLKIGFIRFTNKKDSAGRSIMFGDPSRLPIDHSSYENESICRSLWYCMHVALEDETTQRKGAVFLLFPKHVKFAQFNRKLAKMNAESIKGCIPIRLSALHVCHPPLVFDLIFPIIKVLMGAHLKKKIRVNSGNEGKVLDELENKYGIPREKVPTEMGGGLVLEHEEIS